MKVAIFWSIVAAAVLYILYIPTHPVWVNAGDFLNYNANKGCPACK
jgi:hypothetical protein